MIGTLVFFHELGHFVAARAFGVKCLRFAVGMGPVVAAKQIWDTEFSIRALPLGGYVLMAGANPEEETEETVRGESLADKPVWQRIIIFLAGPLVNILLPIPIMAALLGSATQGPAPIVGWVAGGSPADTAGIVPGDEITSINGDPIRFFEEVREAVMEAGGGELKMSLLRDGKAMEVVVHPKAFSHADPLSKKRKVSGARIGLMSNRYASYVEVMPGSSAARRDAHETAHASAGLAAMAAASTAMVVTFAWKLAIRPVVQEVQALLKSLVDMVELAPVDMFVY
jgi:regulator of sigma E protease